MILEGLCTAVARKTGILKKEAIQRLKTRISIDLQRSIHKSLEKRRVAEFADDEGEGMAWRAPGLGF